MLTVNADIKGVLFLCLGILKLVQHQGIGYSYQSCHEKNGECTQCKLHGFHFGGKLAEKKNIGSAVYH